MTRAKKYMTAKNLRNIENRLDNACSELQIALENISDMKFSNLEDAEELTGLENEIERLGIYFSNIISIKHHFEMKAEELELKE